MFEKEAEEIANKRCHEIMCYGHCSFSSPKHHRCGEWHREYECALKGAEFGYNKANKELKEVKELKAQIEKHIKGNKKLQKVVYADIISIGKLREQIKKMKCCENCNEWYRLPTGQKDCAETNCEKLSHWTMRIKE